MRYDNQVFDVNGDRPYMFIEAMKLAFKSLKYDEKDTRTESASHFAISENNKLTFYWHEPEESKKAQAFPFAYNEEAMIDFAVAWLKQADHKEAYDTDGSVVKGWRVYFSRSSYDENDVLGSFYAILSIEAIWTVYGK